MRFALISLGCPKNQVDADVMCRRLLEAGHTTTGDLSEADLILVNTCGFIESAKTEAIENILMACSYKEQNPQLKVVVTGCLAERYREEIHKEIPEADGVVGLGSNEAIVSILERIVHGEQVQSYGAKTDLPLGGQRVISTPSHYAYLKIAEGCDNRCYYCAIPSIRGPLRSRKVEDCVSEAKWLAAHAQEYGFIIRYPKGKENVTGYQYEPWHLRYLGKEIAQAVYDSGLCLEEYLGIASYYTNE